MEVAETTSTNPDCNPEQSSVCEECGLNPSIYRCPGCSIRSCGLPCVKSHKARTSCTGKRSRTQFVPLSQFDDNLLVSDYNLLEETKRIAESARRRRAGISGHFKFKLPFKLRALKKATYRRKTHLLILPSGMSKREKNQTRYDSRTDCISWTIEWRFHSTNVVLIDNGVDENAILFSAIQKHLKLGSCTNELRPFCKQLDSLKFFIRKNAKGTKSPFREIDIKAPISSQLANSVIVEYPAIHVSLPSTTYDFEIGKEIKQLSEQSEFKEPLDDNFPSQKGVLFREEEVEDDISDPHVLDLMDYINPEVQDISRSANSKRPSPKEPPRGYNEGSGSLGSKEQEDAEEFEFGFEKVLRDAFSGLDEFLDLSGCGDERLMVDDELEEGEIPAL